MEKVLMLIVHCQNAYNYKLWNAECVSGENWRRADAQALTALYETKKLWNAECVNCEDWRRAEAGLLSLEVPENST